MSELLDGSFDQITKFMDKTSLSEVVYIATWAFGTYSVYMMLLAAKFAIEDVSKTEEQHLAWLQTYMPPVWFFVKALQSNPITSPIGSLAANVLGGAGMFGGNIIKNIEDWLRAQKPSWLPALPTPTLIGGTGQTTQQKAFIIKQQINELEIVKQSLLSAIDALKIRIASIYEAMPPFPQAEFNPALLDQRTAMLAQIKALEEQIPRLQAGVTEANNEILLLQTLLGAFAAGVLADVGGELTLIKTDTKNYWDIGLLATAMVITYTILQVGGDMSSIIMKLGGLKIV